MAMTHEQIDEQMVDFLYGELSVDARAAFEAHVAGCERCRREVESFGQVRAVARTVLDDAPPTRVHDAILRAAREAAATAPAKGALKEATKEAKKAEPARASLWDWLRGRWAFPTLATVGALSVFILGSRLFLTPTTTHQLGRPAPVSEPAASAPVPERPMDSTGGLRAVEKAEPTTPASAAAPAEARSEAPARTAHLRREIASEAKAGRSDGAHPAVSAPFGHAGAVRPGAASIKDEPLGGLIGLGAGAREKSSKDDALLEGIGGPARDKAPAGGGSGYVHPPARAAEKPQANADSAPRAVAKKAKRAVDDIEEDRVQSKEEAAPARSLGGKARTYAQPPPPSAAPAPAPRYAEPPPSKAVAADSDSYATSDSTELAKSLPRSTAQAQSRASRGGAAPAPAAPPPAPASAPAVVSRARSRAEEPESESGADESAAARETLAQRAERLYTQGRWAEAAVAYRDLLRQQPNSPDAERWRRRLAAARAAVATGRPPSPSAR